MKKLNLSLSLSLKRFRSLRILKKLKHQPFATVYYNRIDIAISFKIQFYAYANVSYIAADRRWVFFEMMASSTSSSCPKGMFRLIKI